MHEQSQRTLGRYCVEREIGRGAMGVVYRARDPKIDRVVAIKTISLAGQDDAEELEYRERFQQEARAAGRLSHPGMVTIFDAGEDPETLVPFIVMEHVGGQPLSRVIKDAGGKLDLATALQFAIEIADALAYAHSQGVVHGDVKPANVLITADGHAKIADFGVARLNHGLITPGGKIFGSPAYMAPEQLSGAPPDSRSDLFSLGVMLYSMLTGFRPFQGNSAETVCFKVINVEPVPVSSFQTELQPELDRIVSRAIAKEPRDRYQSGFEMAEEIRAFIRSASSPEDTASRNAISARQDSSGDLSPAAIGLAVSKTFLYQAIAIIMLTGLVMAGWQVKNVLRKAAAVVPPNVLSPQAPAIQKTPVPVARHKKPRAPKQEAQPPTQPSAPVENAKLRVEILHHFSDGKASIWIDSQLAFDQDLREDDQRHPVFRAVEMHQIANLAFAPGKHTVEVKVIADASDYAQSEKLDIDLTLGPTHVLLINCDKRKMQVTLQ